MGAGEQRQSLDASGHQAADRRCDPHPLQSATTTYGRRTRVLGHGMEKHRRRILSTSTSAGARTVATVYDLHLRCQALGGTGRKTRPSEARRIAAARLAGEQRLSRLREILREVRKFRKPWY